MRPIEMTPTCSILRGDEVHATATDDASIPTLTANVRLRNLGIPAPTTA